MTVRIILFAWSALALAVVGAAPGLLAFKDRPDDRFLLACSVFSASRMEAELRARFGPQNVTNGLVMDPNGAEGDRAAGTVLFAEDDERRLEISWKHATGKRRQVTGGKIFSSGHPAMQALNPTVYELFMSFGQRHVAR